MTVTNVIGSTPAGGALAEAMALASGKRRRRASRPPYKRVESKPRQEISVVLKYFVFVFNFIAAIIGLSLLTCGLYVYISYYEPITEPLDLLVNVGLLMSWMGIVATIVAMLGAIGALRDDMCLLKAFSFTIFLCYILLVVGAFLMFILFYSQANNGFSISGFLMHALRRYHVNANMKDLLDYIHTENQCCGVSNIGYKDWNDNAQFNCSIENKAVERCGVPFSCCRRPVPKPGAGNTAVEVANSLQSQPALTCWQHAQNLSLSDVQQQINIEGCASAVQRAFENHAVTLGAVVGAFVVPVCLSATLANILAKQIERQKYLLHREARREERRKKQHKHRFKDPFKEQYKPSGRAQISADAVAGDTPADHQIVDESRQRSPTRKPRDDKTCGDKRKVRRRVRSQPAHVDNGDMPPTTSNGSRDEKSREEKKRRARPRDDRIRTRSAAPNTTERHVSSDDTRIVDAMERARRDKNEAKKRMSLAENGVKL